LKVCIEESRNKNLLSYNLQWFAKDGEGGEKTEPATQKKLDDARKEGKVAKSKELTSAFMLIALFLIIKVFVSYIGETLVSVFGFVYNRMADFANPAEIGFTSHSVAVFINEMLLQMLKSVWPFFLFGVLIALVIGIVQVGWKVSTKPLEPKLSKFNPISGFKRIFSKESLFNLVMAIIKVVLIGLVAFFSIRGKAEELFILYEISLNQAIALVGNIIINTGLRISVLYLVVGVIDFAYQKHKFSEDMKMTKQEVKDEYKNTEGDPQVKGQQRRKMQEASQRRMMQDVPKADVVITNPTHLAVALRYDANVGRAPVVVAKGEDYLAQKIKEVARENHVEIVENKPLARMLYHNVDIGAEIPPELYQAVAEVLAAVYRLKNNS
jgi:flagellar biosynthetic protein FlhB